MFIGVNLGDSCDWLLIVPIGVPRSKESSEASRLRLYLISTNSLISDNVFARFFVLGLYGIYLDLSFGSTNFRLILLGSAVNGESRTSGV